MKITVEQHGIKASIEYPDDELDIHQVGALVHSALAAVGWQDIALDRIMVTENFDWSFRANDENKKRQPFPTVS